MVWAQKKGGGDEIELHDIEVCPFLASRLAIAADTGFDMLYEVYYSLENDP